LSYLMWKKTIKVPSGYLTEPWYKWPIEIDGLPFWKMGGSFHGKLQQITRGSLGRKPPDHCWW
jgi:hypothetical protein